MMTQQQCKMCVIRARRFIFDYCTHGLFQRENVLVEEILKLFVGNVYAQLFERIVLEIFKTENIQYSNHVVFASEKHTWPTKLMII